MAVKPIAVLPTNWTWSSDDGLVMPCSAARAYERDTRYITNATQEMTITQAISAGNFECLGCGWYSSGVGDGGVGGREPGGIELGGNELGGNELGGIELEDCVISL